MQIRVGHKVFAEFKHLFIKYTQILSSMSQF